MKTIEKMEKGVESSNGHNAGNRLTAKVYDSGFSKAHDTYNAISVASDGKIYYVLSSESADVGGQMFVFDPPTQKIEFLGDLTEICGEKNSGAVSQGKSHVRFYERNGKLYFGTHVGFYDQTDGMERIHKNPPDGYKLYPGGHFLSYDLKTKQFEDLAIVPGGEGIVSMTVDTDRGHIFAITWPCGNFIHYDIDRNILRNLGPVSGKGEAGLPGNDFRPLCRSLFIEPVTGTVYFSTSEGDIFSFNLKDDCLTKSEADLRLDYFGKIDPTRPGSMGYNWRKIFWHSPSKKAYGVHGNSGYLFEFDPAASKIELVERITSELSKKSGMNDQFSYGYLGFQSGPDKETIYYLTGGPIYINGKRVKGEEEIAKGAAKGLENLHLITYNIPHQKYRDHGPIFYENGDRPLYVNSIAVSPDGNIYTLARITRNNSIVADLISIPDPLFI